MGCPALVCYNIELNMGQIKCELTCFKFTSKWKICLKILFNFCQIYESESTTTQDVTRHYTLHLLCKQCALTLTKEGKIPFMYLEGRKLISLVQKARLDFQSLKYPSFVSLQLWYFPDV